MLMMRRDWDGIIERFVKELNWEMGIKVLAKRACLREEIWEGGLRG